MPIAKTLRGKTSYLAGLAAETAVAADYQQRAFTIVERRWRSPRGEIDLIVEAPDMLVFVEIKKSRYFASAAASLSQRQITRILATAQDYLAQAEQTNDIDLRCDVALVDAQGRIEILENAFM